MAYFDVSKQWTVLALPEVWRAAEDLARCVGLLRKRAGLPPAPAPLVDAAAEAPPPGVPIVVLNAEDARGSRGGAAAGGRNGFTWRAGSERAEIYGESPRGLCNGVYDFLAALGLSWPAPGREILPPPPDGSAYPLSTAGAYRPSRDRSWRRVVAPAGHPALSAPGGPAALCAWAARNRVDSLVVPLRYAARAARAGARLNPDRGFALSLEAGGWEMSRLAPRRLFLFHPDFFRMEEGRRRRRINFCPTSPGMVRALMAEAERRFRAAPSFIRLFHLWPDRGHEEDWCSCPSCRAFTPAEQNRVACNAAADALARVNPGARLAFYEPDGEDAEIPLRPNLVRLERLPEALG